MQKKTTNSLNHTFSKKVILAQLNKILKSDAFVRSHRMSSFLRYVTEKTIDAPDKDIKGYTIGIDVFGKPAGFDTDTDASVRVEAIRLRKALKLYYHEDGINDDIVIQIPKGRYKATFTKKNTHSAKKNLKLAIVASFCVLVIAAATLTLSKHTLDPEEQNTLSNFDIPTVAILPFEIIGDAETNKISQNFSQLLIQNLTRFHTLKTVDIENIFPSGNMNGRGADIGKKVNANYLIEGTIHNLEGKIRIKIRLLDTKKTTYVWTYNKTHTTSLYQENVIDVLGNEVSGIIASEIASPYGVIQNLEQERLTDLNADSTQPYKCILDYYAYCNNKTSSRHAQVRTCLEKVVTDDPNNSDAWAYLSRIYTNEIKYRHNPLQSEASTRLRTLNAAQKSVEIDPKNPRGHQYLAAAALLNGNDRLVRHHTKMSINLNPYNSEILADAAWSYGQMGDWELSREYAKKAVAINSGHPRWYHGILFAYYYYMSEYESAVFHSLQSFQPGVAASMMALAVSYEGLGNHKKAEKLIRRIESEYPSTKTNPNKFIEAYGFQDDFNKKFNDGLKAASMRASSK